ncbi:rSAM-modified peptide [Parabacteroides sp. AF18-52]|nr:rSAM-modified peptide [Parabacteroides sp. AF18-52]
MSQKKMKTLGKLKLNEFRKSELEKRELNTLKGGCSCKCACAGGWDYANTKEGTNGAGRAY